MERNFTQTAQRPEVIGDEARHGLQKWQAPVKPMTWQEAKDSITRIMHRWLNYRITSQTTEI
jgi:hypothetical protein